jgi:hypothetical protein
VSFLHGCIRNHRRRVGLLAAASLVAAACAVGSSEDEPDLANGVLPTEGAGQGNDPYTGHTPDNTNGAGKNSRGDSDHGDARNDGSRVDASSDATAVDASMPVDAGTDASLDDSGATYGGSIAWDSNAKAYRCRKLERFSFDCPAGGTAADVWGVDIYSDDSSICTAAVHAGKITLAGGGHVTIEMRPGELNYRGNKRNGITSKSYSATSAWPCSFVTYPW